MLAATDSHKVEICRDRSHTRHIGVTPPYADGPRLEPPTRKEEPKMPTLVTATPLALLGRWSARSAEQARRNAMTACTVLAARRQERLDVEAFLDDHLARRTAGDPTAPAAAGVQDLPRRVG
jgi:hypothetical protein